MDQVHIQLSHRKILKQVVYLTPDADAPLLDLSPDNVYVIGGLVDEHIIKGLTLDKANKVQD